MDRRSFILFGMASLLAAGALPGGPIGAARPAIAAPADTKVVILRGFADVFSLGMNDLARMLTEDGYPAETFTHVSWRDLALRLEGDYRATGRRSRIILIGHSLGANDVVRMADWLSRRDVPVRLVVTYDPTQRLAVAGNVRRAVNFFLPGGIGRPLHLADGARGSLANVDITDLAGVKHLNMDYSDELWSRTLAEVRRAAR